VRTAVETKPTQTAGETKPTQTASKTKTTQIAVETKPTQTAVETSEDELQISVTPRPNYTRPRNTIESAEREELKMEKSRRRVEYTRRTTRSRKGDILESDALPDELAATPPKARPRQKAPRPKPDTARQRLRDEIAAQTKAKANNFLAAHKNLFLPLLPPNNYVSRLNVQEPIVEYEELSAQPEGVTATMKPYQLSGLSFLVYLHNNGFSGILGDEMGLGKTLQTLSLFQYLEEEDQKAGAISEELRPYLVVCPLSVLNSWVSEAQRWVPQLNVLRFHGTVNERDRLKRVVLGMEDMQGNETTQSRDRKASRKAGIAVSRVPAEKQGSQSYKIVVTTYETFMAEQSWFKHSFIWRYVVLDEGHRIKSNVTNVSTALRTVSSEYRLILTGTPLQNNLHELWSLLAWLYPDVFTEPTGTLFKESFDLSRGKASRQTMEDARNLLELVMLRRMKDSEGVDLNLPPKEEVLLYVPLTPMQRFWYTRLLTRVDDTILDDLFTDIQSKEKDTLEKEKQEGALWTDVENLEKNPDAEKAGEWQETADIMRQAIQKEQTEVGTKNAWLKLMNLVMQLRKCCSHPYLLPGASPEPYYLGDHVIRASGKFILLEKLLRQTIYTDKKKVLIFSGFTQTLDCCEDLLTLISDYGRGFKFLRLDGNTARARRNLDIRMFNNANSEYKVMLLSTRAGGLGINLTSAEDVIFLDEDWNPQITLQAEARAHRIGQTKKVTIYKLCTQGTVEEQMMGRIRKKLYLSAKITESMRTKFGDSAKKANATTEDMPQMDTSQLKSLIRRGAQTLSHPAIDVTEMLSWDLETMFQKCRDKPADPQANPDASAQDVDEEKWLSTMERVECAVFDGKRHQRQLRAGATAEANILPSSISREDRRKGKNVTVMVDGFAINKESLNCADWEAVPTFAGKDPRLAEPKREKRRKLAHESHCLACFEHGDLTECSGCPRSYHKDCLEEEFQSKTLGFGGFYCAQHECVDCGKKTTDAGGLIYRCRWCENGFCEDCLEWDKVELIGENLPEFEMLGEGPTAGAFYIKCPSCKESIEEDDERKQWMMGMEMSYREQHELWLKNRDKEQKELEEEQHELEKAREKLAKQQTTSTSRSKGTSKLSTDGRRWIFQDGDFVLADQSDAASPPALTDTSLPTPAPGGSGVSTPQLLAARRIGDVPKRKTPVPEEEFQETREAKRIRLGQQRWDPENDPLFRGMTIEGGSEQDIAYVMGKRYTE
jgi:SNF2 family DNA or RNA helicase